MTKPNPFDDCILVPSGAITMMNSSADDFDFPPNPFRSTPTGTSNGMQQQSQQQQGFFHSPPVDAAFAPATQQQQQQQQQQQDPLGNHGSFQPQLVQQQHTTVPTNATYGRTATTMLMQPSGMMDNNNQNATSLAPAVGAAPTSRLQACFACFRIDTYRSYFDMDTIDIQNRVKNSLLMCFMPDKFRVQVVGVERNDTTKGPDLYGPLWITMTLIFFLAVSDYRSWKIYCCYNSFCFCGSERLSLLTHFFPSVLAHPYRYHSSLRTCQTTLESTLLKLNMIFLI